MGEGFLFAVCREANSGEYIRRHDSPLPLRRDDPRAMGRDDPRAMGRDDPRAMGRDDSGDGSRINSPT